MPIAFSREGPKKVYVQHLLKERAEEINKLLEQKAYIYVCGDAANMAREVNTVLAQIISEQRGIPEAKAEEIVKNMRASNQYQVCVALGNPTFLTGANETTGGCVVVDGDTRVEWKTGTAGSLQESYLHGRGVSWLNLQATIIHQRSGLFWRPRIAFGV